MGTSSTIAPPPEWEKHPKHPEPSLTAACPGLLVGHFQVSHAGEFEITQRQTRNHTLIFAIEGVQCQNKVNDLYFEGKQRVGDIILIPSGSTCQFSWGGGTSSSLIFLIEPQFLHQVAMHFPKSRTLELRGALQDRPEALISVAKMFYTEMQQSQFADNLYFESLTQLLAIQILREYSVSPLSAVTPEKGFSPKQLQCVIDYINSHLHEKIQLAKIAEVSGFNATYFCTLFRKSMGVTLQQYVLQQRIECAKLLLQKSQLGIADIALQCGFANQSHFTRNFRQAVGITPKIYQRNAL